MVSERVVTAASTFQDGNLDKLLVAISGIVQVQCLGTEKNERLTFENVRFFVQTNP